MHSHVRSLIFAAVYFLALAGPLGAMLETTDIATAFDNDDAAAFLTCLNTGDQFEDFPLHMAACCGRINIARVLIERDGASVNVKNKRGETPLHSALWQGVQPQNCLQMVTLLLEKGADVNAMAERAPLHQAVLTQNPVVVALLLRHINIDVNIQNSQGETPLHLAIEKYVTLKRGDDQNAMKQIITLLLQHAATNPNISDNLTDQTPLHRAVIHARPDIVELLLQKDGIDVNARSMYNRLTPLDRADMSYPLPRIRSNTQEEIITLLRAKGAKYSIELDAPAGSPIANTAAHQWQMPNQLLAANTLDQAGQRRSWVAPTLALACLAGCGAWYLVKRKEDHDPKEPLATNLSEYDEPAEALVRTPKDRKLQYVSP